MPIVKELYIIYLVISCVFLLPTRMYAKGVECNNKTKNLIKQKFNNLWLQLAFFNKHYQTKFIKQLLNFWALHINIFSYFI